MPLYHNYFKSPLYKYVYSNYFKKQEDGKKVIWHGWNSG